MATAFVEKYANSQRHPIESFEFDTKFDEANFDKSAKLIEYQIAFKSTGMFKHSIYYVGHQQLLKKDVPFSHDFKRDNEHSGYIFGHYPPNEVICKIQSIGSSVVVDVKANTIDQYFRPSDEIAQIFCNDHIKEMYAKHDAILNVRYKEYLDSTNSLEQAKEYIAVRFERLITTIGYRAKAANKKVYLISDNGRFVSEFNKELLGRLKIDPYNWKDFSDKLYDELISFLKHSTIKGNWGVLLTDGRSLELHVTPYERHVDRRKISPSTIENIPVKGR
jgi:hypothetical protein